MRNLLLTLVVLLAAAPAHAVEGDFDRWFVLQMQGQRAGWAHMRQTSEDGRITSHTEMMISLRRGPITVQIEQRQQFVETAEGAPVEAQTRLKMGTMAMESSYRFSDAGIEIVSSQGEQQVRRTVPPIAGEWLTPAAAQRYISAQIAQGADAIQVRTLDLSLGVQPIDATMRVAGEEQVEVFGRTVPAIAWEASIASMPGVRMREYVDLEGRPLKTTVSVMPGMDIEMLAADRTLALSPADPPEVMASLLISPLEGSVAMEQPREMVSAVYEVTLKPDATIDSFALPRTGYQRVAWGDERTARVVVDLMSPVPPEEDLPTAEHLAASATLNHEDPKIRELVTQAIPADARLTREGMALRLRAFVHDYMDQKSLDIGFATASEAARTRQGDCSEHAVLLAAMLRAAEIPSRTVTGLVYVDEFIGEQNVFGGHMWTQAWIVPTGDEGDAGGRWIDLDPTLPEHHFDAAHITLGTAAMGDVEIVNELVEQAPLLGSLEVRVIAAEVAEALTP